MKGFVKTWGWETVKDPKVGKWGGFGIWVLRVMLRDGGLGLKDEFLKVILEMEIVEQGFVGRNCGLRVRKNFPSGGNLK